MFKFSIVLGVLALALTVWCLVEAISATDSRVRRVRKPVWILAIVFLPIVGPIAWLLMGRPSVAVERAAAAADFAEFERPGRLDPTRPSDPAKDEAYRKMLRRRAEEQRRRYEQQNKKPDEPQHE